MSRREIRRMLLEPKRRLVDRPWVIPTLMGTVLTIGLALGVGVGIALLPKETPPPPKPVVDKSVPPDSLPQRSDDVLLRPSIPDFVPIVPVPLPRPGGPEDDGYDYGDDAAPSAVSAMAPSGPVGDPVLSADPIPPAAEGALPSADDPPVSLRPLPSAAPPVRPGPSTWLSYTVPAAKVAGRPMVAIMIDDMGVDKKRSERVTHLRAPLTLAWMTYAEDLPHSTQAARARGHELMVHMPMQPMADSFDPGPEVLKVTLPPEEIRRRVNWGLDRFSGFIGINNHMGSRFTADRDGMRVVMEELRRRGLIFVDSVTTGKSVAPDLARAYAVPFAARQIFIDNEQSVAAVTAQLQKAEDYARKHGAAIAIGHPHDATIDALARWLPGLEARGIALVPISAIVKQQNGFR